MGKIQMSQRGNLNLVQNIGYGDVSKRTKQQKPMSDVFVDAPTEDRFFPQPPIGTPARLRTQEVDAAAAEIAALSPETATTVNAPPIQVGSGILDLGESALKGATAAVTAFTTAKVAAKAVGELARGPVGTAISNFLSRKFNKNPEWRPGFPGESHLVLPTEFGLTRANFAGPGTSLQARLDRGDVGVDGASGIDAASKIHDILYNIARNPKDIRDADNLLISDIKRGSAGPKTKALSIKMLEAKKFGENVGVFGPETFTKLPKLGSSEVRDVGRQAGGGVAAGGLGGIAQQLVGARHDVGSQLGGGFIKIPKKELGVVAKRLIKSLDKKEVGAVAEKVISQLPVDSLRKSLLQQLTKSGFIKKPSTEFSGGQLGLLAGLAAKFIVPAIIKAVKKKKKRKKTRKKVTSSGGGRDIRGEGQLYGGQLGLLAGLAANFIVPAIIKAIKK